MADTPRKSLGADLQHLTLSYSHLFLRAADAFLIWDGSGRIQNANGASCLLTGYEKDELLGLDHRDLFTDDLQNMLDTLLLQSQVEKDGNILFEGENEIRDKEGQLIPVTLRFITVQYPEGASVLGIIHDIRDLKDLEARLTLTQARYKGIVENVREIIFLLDNGGKVLFCNAAAEEIIGISAKKLLGTNLRDLAVNAEKQLVDSLLKGEFVELDESGQRPSLSLNDVDGNTREFQFFLSDIPDERNQPGGILLVLHDITGQRELQEKLKHAERMQSVENILSKITHEVKNPLAAINASAEYLRRHWKAAADEEKIEVIELIAEETQRINRVITEYLRVRRVPNPTILEYDIADMVDHVVKTMDKLLTENPEINITTEVERSEVPLDTDMMKQILWNLLNNAIDAIEGSGAITVTGKRLKSEDCYQLVISDSGCGMDDETLKRVFEPFYTNKESGTGLGLPMVRQHIDAMNGYIDLESSPGNGTTFTLKFPLKLEQNA